MELFSFYRSSAAYRVRIALGLKKLPHAIVPVDLTAGEQREKTFLKMNPQGLVPALRLDSGEVIGQSLAILEWLEDQHPDPALYPQNALDKALHRALCQHIACDIHPLNNLRVLHYLEGELALDAEQVSAWYAHWIQRGFAAIEPVIRDFGDGFSLGEDPGMLEVFLVPQVFNARRFKVDLEQFPAICALEQRCALIDAFSKAHPLKQADTPAHELLNDRES